MLLISEFCLFLKIRNVKNVRYEQHNSLSSYLHLAAKSTDFPTLGTAMVRVNTPSKSVFQSSGEDHKKMDVGVCTGCTGCVVAHPSVSKTPKFWCFVSHFLKCVYYSRVYPLIFKTILATFYFLILFGEYITFP